MAASKQHDANQGGGEVGKHNEKADTDGKDDDVEEEIPVEEDIAEADD